MNKEIFKFIEFIQLIQIFKILMGFLKIYNSIIILNYYKILKKIFKNRNIFKRVLVKFL